MAHHSAPPEQMSGRGVPIFDTSKPVTGFLKLLRFLRAMPHPHKRGVSYPSISLMLKRVLPSPSAWIRSVVILSVPDCIGDYQAVPGKPPVEHFAVTPAIFTRLDI
jgi:hypothetical protein